MVYTPIQVIEDDEYERDLGFEIQKDSEKILYNPNCSINYELRAEIASKLDEYFLLNGVDTRLLQYFFSDSMQNDLDIKELNNKGLHIMFDGEYFERLTATLFGRDIIDVAEDKIAAFKSSSVNYKTYRSNKNTHTAITWDDLIEGINKNFESLGAELKITPCLSK